MNPVTTDSYDYLIIGGGQVSDDAARAIRERDVTGEIGILSDDVDAPYTRPALTKKLWTDPDFTEEQVPLRTAEETGADVRSQCHVSAIDRDGHQVRLEDGRGIGYGKLLLATGSEPATLPGPEDERIITFRSFEDYRRLRRLAPEGTRVVVIGGGYIGTELAAALSQNGVQVTLVFPQETLGASRFPTGLAARHQKLFDHAGISLRPRTHVDRIESVSGGVEAVLDDDTSVEADVAVVGLGAAPRLELARDAGLETNRGVVVDEHLRTSDPSIWAAGDIAEYPDAILGRTRIEHVDHARESGAAAGRAMVDGTSVYDHTPYFYSVVLGSHWEAIGQTDPALRTIQVDLEEHGGTVVYYLDPDDGPVGILLWNVDDGLGRARDILRNPPDDLVSLGESFR